MTKIANKQNENNLNQNIKNIKYINEPINIDKKIKSINKLSTINE